MTNSTVKGKNQRTLPFAVVIANPAHGEVTP